ncbi:hypothetical protein HX881_30840 [Pseudomonas gingeri]|uniref:Uncharacterized protein n=1 Tax=Pseudomonas gingeri TaxID=117681 RepID=A0A7Y7YKH3_9PSED|nr:hypothetical protein [Pseudomonas gingeri]NVZ29985.1 hypothetical protein [Pseudomonas gingeri]NWA00182.1 hypothetical protein [Pseudomonas gingeri]NWA15744.1 hypothetical protein [Pseudomonas gingeri]NWA56214.1 hypothetical protein [Pseudomonas gingeri]NWA97347.1 hypothetical protein [Pseudomonas gingeri]
MFDFILGILQGVDLLDSEAQKDNSPTWLRRHRKLIRVLFIICMYPFYAGLLILLIIWLINLGPVAQKVAMGVVAIQVLGLLALLDRRRRTPRAAGRRSSGT